MLAPVTHILPLSVIRRKRMLPVIGKVMVRAGQKVNPTDVIAQAEITPEHISLDISRGLGVPINRSENFIHREVGEDVEVGDSVATRSGLLTRVVRSPHAGKIVDISGGHVLIEVNNDPFELRAGIPGAVVHIEADRGAIIEATGAWIQGLWGNGKINYGELTAIAESPKHVLSLDELNSDQSGKVILAGHCNQSSVLEKAADISIRGLVLSSMTLNLTQSALEMPYPIISTEGFGPIEMNSSSYQLLSTNREREITLNAEPFDRFKGIRPEIIIPLQASGDPPIPVDIENFRTGQKVRITQAPHYGKIATVEYLLPEVYLFPNGIRTTAAQLDIADGKKSIVPLANIEVLG